MNYDIAIVGAGIIGLSIAIGLRKSGFDVVIIETQMIKTWEKNNIPTRVSAINRKSELFLSQLNVWKDILEMNANPYNQMKVYDKEGNSEIFFSRNDINEPNLGHIIENSAIITALYNQARKLEIDILQSSKILDIDYHEQRNQQLIKMKNNSSTANLIIGCDGANSWTRKYFDFDMNIEKYNQTAIVATVKLEKSHNNTAYQKFLNDGILAFLPLKDENKCSIVWSLNNIVIDDILDLNDDEFNKKLTAIFGDILGNITLINKKISFPLISKTVKTYFKKSVVLAGDAGHTIHPLAGQGVNLGFKDAKSLVKILTEAKSKSRSISHDSTLSKYQRERKLDNIITSKTMMALKTIFSFENKAVITIRGTGMNLLNKTSIIKKNIIKKALL